MRNCTVAVNVFVYYALRNLCLTNWTFDFDHGVWHPLGNAQWSRRVITTYRKYLRKVDICRMIHLCKYMAMWHHHPSAQAEQNSILNRIWWHRLSSQTSRWYSFMCSRYRNDIRMSRLSPKWGNRILYKCAARVYNQIWSVHPVLWLRLLTKNLEKTISLVPYQLLNQRLQHRTVRWTKRGN